MAIVFWLPAYVKPGAGPAMHVHFKQDESLTVVSGQLGYQVLGKEPQMAGVGRLSSLKEEHHTSFGLPTINLWKLQDGLSLLIQ
jgi:hypothetical protein